MTTNEYYNFQDIDSFIRSPVPQEVRWERNLEFLMSGGFGDVFNANTLLRYWQAQEHAGYPGASENVRYFEEMTRCNPIQDLCELIKTIEGEI